MAEKHGIGGRRERVSLDSAATHILEECRMVLPGIQALFGFQLIAVFNDGFGEKLSAPQQLLHLAAIVLVYLVSIMVAHSEALAPALAVVLGAFYGLLWLVLPRRERSVEPDS